MSKNYIKDLSAEIVSQVTRAVNIIKDLDKFDEINSKGQVFLDTGINTNMTSLAIPLLKYTLTRYGILKNEGIIFGDTDYDIYTYDKFELDKQTTMSENTLHIILTDSRYKLTVSRYDNIISDWYNKLYVANKDKFKLPCFNIQFSDIDDIDIDILNDLNMLYMLYAKFYKEGYHMTIANKEIVIRRINN